MPLEDEKVIMYIMRIKKEDNSYHEYMGSYKDLYELYKRFLNDRCNISVIDSQCYYYNISKGECPSWANPGFYCTHEKTYYGNC